MTASGANWWSVNGDPSPVSVPDRTDELGSGAFVAVVAFTLVLLVSPQSWFPVLAPLRLAFVSAGTAIALVLWNRWKERKSLLQPSGEVVVAMMLPLWAFITLPLSFWPGGSIAVLSSLYVKALMTFWLLANVVTSFKRLRFLATALILCTVLMSITAVKNYVTGVFFSGRILGYDAGLTANPNDLALMLNLLMPLGIALFLSTDKISLRVVYLVILAIDVVGVIVTFSRAGFLALTTLGIVYFFKLLHRPGADRFWASVILMLALMSLPFLPSSYIQRVSTVADIQSDPTGSSQARWRDNIAAIRFVMEHPITGAGIGMDTLALNQVRGKYWSMVHNVYLEYAVDLGVPGLVLFLLLLVGVYRAAREAKRRMANVPARRKQFLLAEGIEVSLIVFAVAGAFHPVAYHFYFYYAAGLALGMRAATRALPNADEWLAPHDLSNGARARAVVNAI